MMPMPVPYIIIVIVLALIIGPAYGAYHVTHMVKDIKDKTLAARTPASLPVSKQVFYFGDIPTTYLNKYHNKHLPLTAADFYWASSWQTYLPSSATYGVPSYDAITNALVHNARVINLDVYCSNTKSNFDINAEPVVRPLHFLGRDKPLEFKKCMELIAEYAWSTNTNYPLILALNMDFDKNKFILAKMAKYIRDAFQNGAQLLDKKYGFNGRDGRYPLGEIPIQEMMGKVAIITNTYPNAGSFDEITNGVASNTDEYIKLIQYDESTTQYGGIGSIMSDTAGLIDHNRTNLSYVAPIAQHNALAIVDPKIDIFNPDADDAFKYGCQFVFMNYQTDEQNDKNIMLYHTKFASGGIQLKPTALRYIPVPPPIVKKQNPELSYKPQQVSVHNGWGKINM
jgi:hypothetical protein